jgi:hypothetical protein
MFARSNSNLHCIRIRIEFQLVRYMYFCSGSPFDTRTIFEKGLAIEINNESPIVVRDEIKTSMLDKKVRMWVGKNFKKFLSSNIDYVDYYCNERRKWWGKITVKT